jgi:hypothetical protein
MAQQQFTEQNKPGKSGRIWTVTACLVGGMAFGYALGQQHPAMQRVEVRCLSAVGTISCTDDSDTGHGEFWVPRDIAWTDSGGSLHIGDRPKCLPPNGRGTEGPIGITWVTVKVAETSWKQAVGVEC